jgi:DNA-binding transcriptional ArsR family regulator
MVEYTLNLDTIFNSLADPTRRDILEQVSRRSLTIGEIAQAYDLTFAAVSKHIKVLEKARLINKHKRGREHVVELTPQALAPAMEYLEMYRQMWERRLDALEIFLKETKE